MKHSARISRALQRNSFRKSLPSGVETRLQALGFWAVQWLLPRELVFASAVIEPRLDWLVQANQGWLKRMKAVFRTGLGPSWLVQTQGLKVTGEDSAFRRDSRIEIVLSAAPTDEFLDLWRELWRDAANPPFSSVQGHFRLPKRSYRESYC